MSISKTESYEGYYADMDVDGTVDGIIYADLMAGATSGTWSTSNSSTYSYTAITEAKDYYVSQDSYKDDFGEKAVISPIDGTSGNDRFYVMALDDFTTGTYSTFYWYYNAKGVMSDYRTYTSKDFGAGKANTSAMIEKWNSSGYGAQNDRDLWGVIQDKVKEGWFIPSRGEWSAFGAKLGYTTENYWSFGLGAAYWTSSQSTGSKVYSASNNKCMTTIGYVDYCIGVYLRLAATF